MIDHVAVLDSDTLSELSRGNPKVVARARQYLERHGRLTITAISAFERLRGYRAAINEGKPYERQLEQFENFLHSCIVLPFDDEVASSAATVWAGLSKRHRNALADILIAATAAVHRAHLVTRNRRDFEPIAKVTEDELVLVDWTR